MGNSPASVNLTSLSLPAAVQKELITAPVLLRAAEYDRLAKLLQNVQILVDREGRPAVANLLFAAQQLCVTGLEHKSGASFHQNALDQAATREARIREHLQTIFSVLTQPKTQTAVSTAEQKQAAGDKLPGLWQRIQQALGGEPPAAPLLEPDAAPEKLPVDMVKAPRPYPETQLFEAIMQETAVSHDTHGQRALSHLYNRAVAAPPPLAPYRDTITKPASQPGESEHLHAIAAAMSAPLRKAEPPLSSLYELLLTMDQAAPVLLLEAELPAPPLAEPIFPAPVEAPQQTPRHALVIYCFGPFRVYQNDELITEWSSLKALAILKYIVARRGKPIAKDMLMEAIWPEVDIEAARRNLHQAVYSLRKTLRHRDPKFQHVQFQNDNYLLNSDMGMWVDFVEFEKYVQEGQRLEAAGQTEQAFAAYGVAEGLYQGDFCEDDLYADWANVQREQLHNMYLNVAGRLSEYYVERNDYVAAIALCQKALAYEPSYEAAHRRLMRCYLAQGQRHLAVRQYQTCVAALAEELDLAPSPETAALYQSITTTAK